MRVLNFANVAGKIRGGGVHEVVYSFFRIQNTLNIDAHLWFPGFKSEEEELQSDLKIEDKEKVKALDTFFNPNFGLLKSNSTVKKKILNYDIIHQHGIWLPISKLSTFAKKHGKHLIIQPHGYLEQYSLGMSTLKKKIMYYLFEKRNLTACSILVGCSKREVENIRELFPNKDIALIPNGVFREFIEAPIIFKKKKEKKKILYLSRVHPSKGIERMLIGFASLPEKIKSKWEINIAGNGDLLYIKKLIEFSKDLQIIDSVHFLGSVFKKDKIELIDNCDLFILPTYTENFGIVVIEALARSVPVLTTKGAPWEDLLKNNCGFWVENTQNGINEGMLEALSCKKEKLTEMGKNGKKMVVKNYVWEDITLKTIELYKWLFEEINEKPAFVFSGDKSKKNPNIFNVVPFIK